MDTVSFLSVLKGVASRMGHDITIDLPEKESVSWTEYINDRLNVVWNAFPWWPWVNIEARKYRDDYDAATNYQEGAQVFYEEAYYEALGSTTNNLPTDETYWKKLSAVVPYIALEQKGKNVIGDVIGIWTAHPYENDQAHDVDYALNGDRVYLLGCAPKTAYVEWCDKPSEFTTTQWDNATAYVAGDLVLYMPNGECYEALQDGTGKNPSTETSYWKKQIFPKILASYVKHAASSDALREDEQYDKADRMEAAADGYLEAEIDRIAVKQNQTKRFRVKNR